jgi:hypothetical protein
MRSRRGDNQTIGRISMETRRKRIGGNHDIDIEWEQCQHPWIGRARNPVSKRHWELDTLSRVEHLRLPQADGSQM